MTSLVRVREGPGWLGSTMGSGEETHCWSAVKGWANVWSDYRTKYTEAEGATVIRFPDIQHKGGESEYVTRSKPQVAGRILLSEDATCNKPWIQGNGWAPVAIAEQTRCVSDRCPEVLVVNYRPTVMRLSGIQHQGESAGAIRSKPQVTGRILLVAGVLRKDEQMFNQVMEPNIPWLREWATAMRLPDI